MRKTRNTTDREWASRIVALRRRMGVSQAELGTQLNSSAMAVSRWERERKSLPPISTFSSVTSPGIRSAGISGDEPDCIAAI